MSDMKNLPWIGAVVLSGLTACKLTVGECWPSGEGGGDGVGGGVILPAGAGGYGNVPPEPQDAAEAPACIITDPPEIQKTCEDMYERCQEIGGKCTKGYPGCDTYGKSSCARCLEACNAGTEYPPACKCRSCGFKE